MDDFPRDTLVWVPETDREWVRHVLGNVTSPLLAIQPAARWLTKRWPIECFAGVAAKAVSRYGCTVMILGSAADEPLADRLEHSLERLFPDAAILNFAGAASLKRLAALLAAADVLLCNDSGPMHLAAGMGTPVVVPFACTTPARSAPPAGPHEFLSATVPCAGSYKKSCPHAGDKHLACMQTIGTEQVWAALSRVMQGLETKPSKAA
jgi:ADP-heptose:LPS heptosyltransferase